jgi:hypothetical protein
MEEKSPTTHSIFYILLKLRRHSLDKSTNCIANPQTMPDKKTLYVIYNANGSFFGKLQYGYRKMTCNKQQDNPCAACDITHGGLSLNETPAWQEAKRKIQDSYGLPIKQLHLDELTPEVSHTCAGRRMLSRYYFY